MTARVEAVPPRASPENVGHAGLDDEKGGTCGIRLRMHVDSLYRFSTKIIAVRQHTVITKSNIYTFTHIDTHSHAHTHKHLHTYKRTHVHTHTHKHTDTHTHIHTHAHTHARTHARTHTHTHTHARARTHTHTHIYIYIYKHIHTWQICINNLKE